MLKNYKELKVWQKSYQLCLVIYKATKTFPKNEGFGMTSQIRRAALSVKVIMGNLGSKNRMDYTVIGDNVNIAARLQEIAKGGEIIVGDQTYHQARGPFQARKIGEIQVKNKIKPVTCYQINPSEHLKQIEKL